jgi:hypothetical protein
LVIGTSVGCLVVGSAITLRAAELSWRDPVMWSWTALVLLGAAALVWNALYAAALSAASPGPGPVIPVFDWLFTFLPALVAGGLFARRPLSQRRTVAVGTGMVTVPLLALSWALLDSSGDLLQGVAGAVWDTAAFGIAPLAGGVKLAGALGGSESAGFS